MSRSVERIHAALPGSRGRSDAFGHIFGRWLPGSGYPRAGPRVESYDERFDPRTGEGVIDIHVQAAPQESEV